MSDFLHSRRALLRQVLMTGLLVTCPDAFAGPRARLSLTDIAGLKVNIDLPVQKILLGDGALAYVLALLLPGSPFDGVVGWGENFKAADLDGYRAYLRKFPEIGRIPSFPAATLDSIGSELAISLQPDVVLMNLSSKAAAESSGLLVRLTQAGIPSVFVDFRTRMFGNTEPSIQLLGALFGQSDRALAFLKFREEQIERVSLPLQNIRARPRVIVERAAGLYDSCCLTYGDGNFGELVSVAGGDNLGNHFLSGAFGTLHPEQVIASDPDVILVTGANWSLYSPNGDWVNLGPGADALEGLARLRRLMRRPAYRSLRAVREGQVYAIWHAFYDSPYYFVALQRLAKWLHPELFVSLDPDATFRELHARFLPVPYQSGYWLSMKGTRR